MRTVSSLVFRSAPSTAAFLAWVAIAWCVLALLAFVVGAWSGPSLPTPEGIELGPFRWWDAEVA